jgi:outer membrane protein OmpA-like peptidoglycan-associated protein
MTGAALRAALAVVALALPSTLVGSWLSDAGARLEARGSEEQPKAAIASVSEDAYCTAELKGIVRRVASACGLIAGTGGRGCQPAQAKQIARLSGEDFNKLFLPLSKRAGIIQFPADGIDLSEEARRAVEAAWANQRGASFFFVVARASPDGKAKYNEKLSQGRAESVLKHLEERFADPDIRKQVGLLWLGEGFAQLGGEFCSWNRSGTGPCTAKEINRSAFVAWIDCAI